MMNRVIIKRLIFLTLIIFTFQQCAKSKTDLNPEASKSIIKGAPDWYLDTPTKEGFKLVSSSATSQDMQVAINKASLDAANTLASMVRSEMNALVKRVREETGHEDDSDLLDRFSQVQEQVVATTLEDWKVAKKNIYREKNSKGNNIFRAYVLIEWDEGAAQKRFLDKIKSEKEIYEAIRATELYEEMEDKVEKYRERYGY